MITSKAGGFNSLELILAGSAAIIGSTASKMLYASFPPLAIRKVFFGFFLISSMIGVQAALPLVFKNVSNGSIVL